MSERTHDDYAHHMGSLAELPLPAITATWCADGSSTRTARLAPEAPPRRVDATTYLKPPASKQGLILHGERRTAPSLRRGRSPMPFTVSAGTRNSCVDLSELALQADDPLLERLGLIFGCL